LLITKLKVVEASAVPFSNFPVKPFRDKYSPRPSKNTIEKNVKLPGCHSWGMPLVVED